MRTEVEQLGDNRVRLTVEVPGHDVRHAVDHAVSDLAASVRIPGFRRGKVPMPVLIQRVGRERVYGEAVESHIGGWFRSAAARSRIHPVEQPQYDYELPASSDSPWRICAFDGDAHKGRRSLPPRPLTENPDVSSKTPPDSRAVNRTSTRTRWVPADGPSSRTCTCSGGNQPSFSRGTIPLILAVPPWSEALAPSGTPGSGFAVRNR